MKAILTLFLFLFFYCSLNAQCAELIYMLKNKNKGDTYTTFENDNISKLTFYDIMIDSKMNHYAIVCFKNKNSASCEEYIYKVDSKTKLKYSAMHYKNPEEGFRKYILPFENKLGCGKVFE